MPTISVVMRVFDGVETLGRAIESVVSQTMPDWELIVVDDQSADGSDEEARRRADRDRRIQVLRTAQRSGAAAAANLGLKHAGGEYVCYLESRDQWNPDYLQQVERLQSRADVLVFRYEIASTSPDGEPRVRLWDPSRYRRALFARNVALPLGIAHRRTLIAACGDFNEGLFQGADWDLWKRFARAGAEFLFVSNTSGRRYLRGKAGGSLGRPPEQQRRGIQINRQSRRPVYAGGEQPKARQQVKSIVFASAHSLIDFSSGAAIATSRALQLLHEHGFACQAFCGSWLDLRDETLVEELLAKQGRPYEARQVKIGGRSARMLFGSQGGVPVTVFGSVSTRGNWLGPDEPAVFLQAYARFLEKNRPDVVVTYGGDPVTRRMIEMTKCYDIPVVFWLHNFAYGRPDAFQSVDYSVVPSHFSAEHYWRRLGLACDVLPNVVDPERVRARQRKPQYVTFVNPHPTKGVHVFARLAAELIRRRPDIPVLLVESRGKTRGAQERLVDCPGIRVMANTADPRKFYGITRIVLMPSLWNESFGLVAAEAMTNGIPVLASSRGALPEIVGDAGFLFDIPAQYTPESCTIPTAAEVEPWIETIIRLWDDPGVYADASRRASEHARRWHPDRLGPVYRDFFANLFPQPAAPVVPVSIASSIESSAGSAAVVAATGAAGSARASPAHPLPTGTLPSHAQPLP